jgi:ParB family chromosome partitioning protein
MERGLSVKLDGDLKNIPMSQIDTADKTCHLGLPIDPIPLADSIRTVGLINPPILRQRPDFKYQIVCGFRRVAACQVLGWHEIKSRIPDRHLSAFDLLNLAIHENRSHRPLHDVEKAQGIRKLAPHLSPDDRLSRLSSLLGFPQNRKVYDKLEALSGLPEAVQAGVIEETLSFEAAVLLAGFSHDDALSCFLLLKPLKLSQNKQTGIITWIQEIAILEEIQPAQVIRSEPVQSLLSQPDLNRNQKGSMLRAYLRKRRFPMLARAEEKFAREVGTLKLDEHIHITPPPSFEGGPYTLRMTFSSPEDFDERLKALNAMGQNPALKRLLKPFD